MLFLRLNEKFDIVVLNEKKNNVNSVCFMCSSIDVFIYIFIYLFIYLFVCLFRVCVFIFFSVCLYSLTRL